MSRVNFSRQLFLLLYSRKVGKYQSRNQNPLIEEGQTTQ